MTTGGAARPPMRRFGNRRRVCIFCVDKIDHVDYKAAGRLRRFVSERTKMDSGKKSGNCARHQRMVTTAIKRARHLALLPYAPNHLRVTSAVAAPAPAAPPAPEPEAKAATEVEAEAPPAEEPQAAEDTESPRASSPRKRRATTTGRTKAAADSDSAVVDAPGEKTEAHQAADVQQDEQ